jgi:glutathione synthase
LVTREANLLRDFLTEHGDVIFKPLDAMGGTGIFRVRQGDPNLNVIIETTTHLGQRTIMAQRFIAEIHKAINDFAIDAASLRIFAGAHSQSRRDAAIPGERSAAAVGARSKIAEGVARRGGAGLLW